MMPELQIPSLLKDVFPDMKISPEQYWFGFQALNIRRAFTELDGTLDKRFRLLKAVLLGCYPPAQKAHLDALLVAKGDSPQAAFKGFALTPNQLQSLATAPPNIQDAMQGIIDVADIWPNIAFQEPAVSGHLGWCIETIAQVFRDRAAGKVTDLDIAFGFSSRGQGRRPDRRKTQSKGEWEDNCFDLHLLHLSGVTIPSACKRYGKDRTTGKKSGSPETFEKMYRRWRKHPITAVRLHPGDPLAQKILSLPDVQELIEERFPHPSQ